jgi:hypothetical protein
MDDPFDLKEVNGLTLITSILLLGMTSANLCRILRKFSNIKKRTTEKFIASTQSKKMVNLTVHFIT